MKVSAMWSDPHVTFDWLRIVATVAAFIFRLHRRRASPLIHSGFRGESR